MKLLEEKDSHIITKDEYIIRNCVHGLIQFSEDGKYFAYLSQKLKKKEHTVDDYRIYVLENFTKTKDEGANENEREANNLSGRACAQNCATKLFDKLRNKEYACQFSSNNLPPSTQKDLSFIEHLEFDNNNSRYLIGFGKTSFLLLKLDVYGDAKVHSIKNSSREYEKILDLSFTSTDCDNDFNMCKIACKVANNN